MVYKKISNTLYGKQNYKNKSFSKYYKKIGLTFGAILGLACCIGVYNNDDARTLLMYNGVEQGTERMVKFVKIVDSQNATPECIYKYNVNFDISWMNRCLGTIISGDNPELNPVGFYFKVENPPNSGVFVDRKTYDDIEKDVIPNNNAKINILVAMAEIEAPVNSAVVKCASNEGNALYIPMVWDDLDQMNHWPGCWRNVYTVQLGASSDYIDSEGTTVTLEITETHPDEHCISKIDPDDVYSAKLSPIFGYTTQWQVQFPDPDEMNKIYVRLAEGCPMQHLIDWVRGLQTESSQIHTTRNGFVGEQVNIGDRWEYAVNLYWK